MCTDRHIDTDSQNAIRLSAKLRLKGEKTDTQTNEQKRMQHNALQSINTYRHTRFIKK